MFSVLGFLAVAASAVFGFFAPGLADRIIANYPGTWADVVCGRDSAAGPRNDQVSRALSGVAVAAGAAFLLYLTSNIFLVFAAWLFALAVLTDIKARLIPDILTFPLMLAGAAAAAGGLPWMPGFGAALFAAAAGYVMASLMGALYYKKSDVAIGGGDIKLISAGGLLLGLTGLSVALVVAAVAAYIWMRSRVKPGMTRNKFVPLAPFFAFGAMVYLAFFKVFL
ncbi:MAG: prepilin peptidase [Rickettsiales bacterium]|nr:prepilin peptidase [Rickettsiales bacterium]